MNFNIIEGYDDGVDIEEFRKDYLNVDLTRLQICEKWGITLKNYNKYRKRLVEAYGYGKRKVTSTGRPSLSYEYRYIYKYTDGYHLMRTINGLLWTVGVFPSPAEAKFRRDELEQYGWFNDN